MTATPKTRYCRCGARLARDNAGTRCSACVAANRDRLVTAPEVPADFWDEVVLREALASRHMGRVIRAWRTHPYHGRQSFPQDRVAAWAEITQTQLSRIENGAPMMHLDRLIQWARILRIPPERLWFAMPDSDRQITTGATSAVTGAPIAIEAASLVPVVTDGELLSAEVDDSPAWVPSETTEPANAPDGTDWPVWFGMRLAHAVSMVHNWTGEHSDTLQTLLNQEILVFDASAPYGGQPVFETSRRQALITLATLPLVALGAPRSFSESNAATEFFLSHCGASLTACWHLLKGSDLDTVDRLLNGYLMGLETVARRPSKYQGTAARLTSQGHRISGIIALHRNHIRAREHHCRQAIEYASLAEDVGSRVSALISLASTYFYDSDPVRAAETYENALVFDADMSPLQRSRTRAELSVVYGQLGRERETLESAELAEQLYPVRPEHDPSYLYAEFTRASLILEQGLAYAALAQRRPERGYQQTAANVFARIEQAAQTPIPDRIKYEIINHQASTAVLLGDLEAFEDYVTRGVEGAILLGSKQRQREVRAAWRLANESWPTEPRLKALGRDLMPALTAN